jgi:hypothetical protein
MGEYLIIMRKGATNEQQNSVIKAVQAGRGSVGLRYPPRVFVGQTNQDKQQFLKTLRAQDGVSAVYTSRVPKPEKLRLDRAGLQAVRGWNLRRSEKYQTKKAARRGKSFPVDSREGLIYSARVMC